MNSKEHGVTSLLIMKVAVMFHTSAKSKITGKTNINSTFILLFINKKATDLLTYPRLEAVHTFFTIY